MKISKLYLLSFLISSYSGAAPFSVQKIVTGARHSCALSARLQMKCWGEHYWGQLGNTKRLPGLYPNSMGSHLPAVDLGPDFVIRDMAVGDRYSCALSTTGRVKCWGAKLNLGQEIDGADGLGHRADEMGSSLKFSELGSFRAIGIAGGHNHTCVWSDKGRAKCWGANKFTQANSKSIEDYVGTHPGTMGDNLDDVPLPKPVTFMDAGGWHTCAIAAGKVYCWGLNQNGQIGIESGLEVVSLPVGDPSKLKSVALESPSTNVEVLTVTLGGRFTCALYKIKFDSLIKSPSKVKCWGSNWRGVLGIGSSVESLGGGVTEMGEHLPEVDLAMGEIVDIKASNLSVCALNTKGQIKCWGDNSDGQLGLEHRRSLGESVVDMSQYLPILDLGLPAIQIAKGSNDHRCAVLVNHGIKCWGSNAQGQLGLERNVLAVGSQSGDMSENLPFVSL